MKTNLYYSPSGITFEGINIEFAPFFIKTLIELERETIADYIDSVFLNNE
jgi:hypothetical protein